MAREYDFFDENEKILNSKRQTSAVEYSRAKAKRTSTQNKSTSQPKKGNVKSQKKISKAKRASRENFKKLWFSRHQELAGVEGHMTAILRI